VRARAAREALGLNQSEVAERLGITVEVYGRMERDIVTPRLTTFVRLCEILRVAPNDLLVTDTPMVLRNEGSPDLRQLVAVLDGADAVLIRRLTDIARWLRGAPRPDRKAARRRAG
jgi:transcriptional regulator with XRE-family HTH domain